MPVVIGIRREDKNPWERRVPLIPSHLRELGAEGAMSFIVQPSPTRVFRDDDFRLEGVPVGEDLSSCRIVLAVKEIPVPLLRPGTVYLFFSHTIKGQLANRPMLRRLAELGCTLIDYERIVNEKGQRLLFFGKQAGEAGLIDTLWALGRRLRAEGLGSPFGGLLQTYHYTNLNEAKEKIAEISLEIERGGLAAPLVPFVVGLTGYGHVSLGAQGILDLLPVTEIPPESFQAFRESGRFSPHRVYKLVFREEHMVRPREAGRLFDLQEYYTRPELYEPVLEAFLPHLTVLVNGIYWAPRFPHFVSKDFIARHYASGNPRLRVIGDISCDIQGGVECTLRATDPGDPVYVYDPVRDAALPGVEGPGPVVMAVDNLPAEISLESSIFFSQALKPFLPALARADFTRTFAECLLPDPIRRAVILFRGELTPDYGYMRPFLELP